MCLGLQEIKIYSEEPVLVLCSALKWRVAIVAKQGMTIEHYLDPLNPQWLGFAIWSGLALVQFKKKMSVKLFLNKVDHF